MKCLILILIFALANRVYADNLCFSDKAVRDVQAVSNSIDKCFFSDINNCGLSRKTIEEQKEINATRLIPYDRTSGDGFYDSATGVVSASFIGGKLSGNVHVTTGNKISRCHVLTSAHLLFKEGRFPINSKDSDVNINFHSGQACEHGKIPESVTSSSSNRCQPEYLSYLRNIS